MTRAAFRPIVACRSYSGAPEGQFVHVDPGVSNEQRHVIDAGEPPAMGTSKAQFNDAQYVRDLRGAFSSVPRPKPRWQDRYMKLMIVGETGQGERSTSNCQPNAMLPEFAVLLL